jgi:hypothetical protein
MLSASTISAQNFCKGDFNFNGSVAAEDVDIFLDHFGRSPFNIPCPPDGPSPVVKTGQTTSYAPGDDGDLEKGLAWPNPRFTDNGNGTVTDNLTGLMWFKDANYVGTEVWEDALSEISILNFFNIYGYDDWRLPNKRELISLTHDRYYSPAVPNTAGTGQWSEGDPFTNVQSNYYWSSTTYVLFTNLAWYVYMSTGHMNHNDKTNAYYVWPVRGGQ